MATSWHSNMDFGRRDQSELKTSEQLYGTLVRDASHEIPSDARRAVMLESRPDPAT
jgi:hypothetical protein